jgi:hypothetical protein
VPLLVRNLDNDREQVREVVTALSHPQSANALLALVRCVADPSDHGRQALAHTPAPRRPDGAAGAIVPS